MTVNQTLCTLPWGLPEFDLDKTLCCDERTKALLCSILQATNYNPGSSQVSPVVVQEHQTITQSHYYFSPFVRKYNSPKAFCGAAAPATLILLVRLLSSFGWNWGALQRSAVMPSLLKVPAAAGQSHQAHLFCPTMNCAVFAPLADLQSLTPQLETALHFYHQHRTAYVERNPSPVKKKSQYLRSWFANFEISDYLRHVLSTSEFFHQMISTSSSVLPIEVLFFRKNQWPIKHQATFEEKERLVEEKRFGGRCGQEPGTLIFREGDCSLFVESVSSLPCPESAEHPQKRHKQETNSEKCSRTPTNEVSRTLLSPVEYLACAVCNRSSSLGPPTRTELSQAITGQQRAQQEFAPRLGVVDLIDHYAVLLLVEDEIVQPSTSSEAKASAAATQKQFAPRIVLLNSTSNVDVRKSPLAKSWCALLLAEWCLRRRQQGWQKAAAAVLKDFPRSDTPHNSFSERPLAPVPQPVQESIRTMTFLGSGTAVDPVVL